MWRDIDNCPCQRDCPDRMPACHGSCPKYKEWTVKRDAAKKVAALQHERYCMTDAARKAYWNKCRRDPSKAYKKFSQ